MDRKYKVQIVETTTYVVDVLAPDEQEATDRASIKWNEIAASGIAHYHQDGDTETRTVTVFDVTDTDDSFSA